jgi:hypothetical protein
MKVFSVVIMIEDDGSSALCDMIEYQGEMWLVPEWLPGSRPKTERPTRIIFVPKDRLKPAISSYQADFSLDIPVSKDALAGRQTTGIRVVENPAIEFQDGRTLH